MTDSEYMASVHRRLLGCRTGFSLGIAQELLAMKPVAGREAIMNPMRERIIKAVLAAVVFDEALNAVVEEGQNVKALMNGPKAEA